jgi:subtilase family serine protease
VEWAGAIAPKATIFYVYGTSVTTAITFAVSQNIAQVLSISFGGCEVNFAASFYRSVGQQANAQGMTILAASGDAGAAGCDRQDSEPLATRGLSPAWPVSLPEVTEWARTRTQFVEGTGNIGRPLTRLISVLPAPTFRKQRGTSPMVSGLGSTGSGSASRIYSRPAWQTGPGVPNDNARHVPDIALSAAGTMPT